MQIYKCIGTPGVLQVHMQRVQNDAPLKSSGVPAEGAGAHTYSMEYNCTGVGVKHYAS